MGGGIMGGAISLFGIIGAMATVVMAVVAIKLFIFDLRKAKK